MKETLFAYNLYNLELYNYFVTHICISKRNIFKYISAGIAIHFSISNTVFYIKSGNLK